ncbi:ATP-binding protein [Arthrobacter crystallopoietes]|uniref:ATP-binding protein n=1 Tax=Crystallibacter crystallopoietes TaxID=37928 RepID=UPI001ABDCBC9|nr:ATP-binding protein [Arthrobacter crystallopoietes]QTG81756.1 ATP-binding protein [Arthrobacter crystallopoietes]
MDQVLNPYTPNAGATPELVVGRDELLKEFETLLRRLARGRTDQSMIVTGLRGVGKTVLLGEFRQIADDFKWKVLELEASKHDDNHFRQTLYSKLRASLFQVSPRARWGERARNAAQVLQSFSLTVDPTTGAPTLSLEVEPAEGLADHGDLTLDLTDVLVAIGEAAADHGTGLVLLFDEVQFLSRFQLEAIIQAIHKTVQRKLPVTFVGAGLPQIAELAGDAKSYAERLFKFPRIGSLEEEDAARALAEPALAEGARFEQDALERAFKLTEGYPYFIQELGYQVWMVANDQVITLGDVEDAKDAYEAKLDESFFRVRLDRATQLQIAYMRAMAELGPESQKAADVAAVMGRESTQLAPTRSELIAMGLLYTPSHGYAGFTVPHFDRFMLRAVPELEVPKLQKRRPKKKG